jgi:hypothetical protein
VPPLNVTFPVGVGLPEPPLTVTVTPSDWVVVMLVEAGVTVTAGVGGMMDALVRQTAGA